MSRAVPGFLRSAPVAGEPAYQGDDATIYANPDPDWASNAYDIAVGGLSFLLFSAGSVVLAILMLAAWALSGALGALSGTSAGGLAGQVLQAVFVNRLCEVSLYLTTQQVRGSIRAVVLDALRPSLDPDHHDCKGLTIVAHSWGAVVALDCLRLAAADPKLRQRDLTLVTVGAALNRVWEIVPADALWQDLALLRPWLQRVRWINMWARYDAVPAGPLDPSLRRALNPSQESAGATVYERRVVNLDDPLADHTSYWENGPEVQARLDYEILRRNEPGPVRQLAPRPGPGVKQAVRDAAQSAQAEQAPAARDATDVALDRIAAACSEPAQQARRAAVGELSLLRLLGYAAAALLLVLCLAGSDGAISWAALVLGFVVAVLIVCSLWLPAARFAWLAVPALAVTAVLVLLHVSGGYSVAGALLRLGRTIRAHAGPTEAVSDGVAWIYARLIGLMPGSHLLDAAVLLLLLLMAFELLKRYQFEPAIDDPLLQADLRSRALLARRRPVRA